MGALRLTDEVVLQIKEDARSGMTHEQIARKHRISKASVVNAMKMIATPQSRSRDKPKVMDAETPAEKPESDLKESGLADAVESARMQIRVQLHKMRLADEAGDENAFARASRLHITAATLLGRLCAKDERDGLYVSKEEIEQARNLVLRKMKEYAS